MSIQIKNIGNQKYKYEVKWDNKEKKQRWRYIGKVTNEPESIGKSHDTGLSGKLKMLLYASMAISVLFGFLADSHPYFWWNEHPAFFAIFGFVVCVLIALGSRSLGHYLKREVDYYD